MRSARISHLSRIGSAVLYKISSFDHAASARDNCWNYPAFAIDRPEAVRVI